ncbi:elongation factor P 5-aminopentanone reductase [Bacillus taeanensis]|uniref:Short chain dehydrogenase n=1 Tax=Bacillus taeanensis TaxID=273032 RepID=A0A366XVI2_9BACI|nr:SDR family oxidoreductase [Bacillus taeanensis]RBW69907.1 short chain dehydrogenase [Bacillus taeanensis]
MEKYGLITGASGGIGRSIAKQLAVQGYGLYLHYNKNKNAADALAKELEKYDVPIYTLQADFSRENAAEKVFAQLHHPIEVLIHNSGNSYIGLLTDMEDKQVQEMIQLHLTTPILLTKRLLQNMIKNKQGNIIVVSSIWGLTGASCEVIYSTVKGGLNTFVKALAKENAPSGIYVNGIAPGAIQTNMLNEFTASELADLQEEIPMGRVGKPSEVADLVGFLTSQKASYINGQIISVNGAWYC